MPVVWSIVVAGGAGARFGSLKQFALLAGRPVLEWAVEACRGVSAGVVLVLPAGPDEHGNARFGADTVVAGGSTRAESVRCGLAAVPADAEVIVVHDAARPVSGRALFEAVLGALADEDVAGVVPGQSPGDTIKVVDEEGWVVSTPSRRTLVAVQTPQAFRAAILRQAHAAPDPSATDDAMMVEAAGGRVRVVPGDPENLKITTPGDLDVAQRVLDRRVPTGASDEGRD